MCKSDTKTQKRPSTTGEFLKRLSKQGIPLTISSPFIQNAPDLKSQLSDLAEANAGLLRALRETEDQCSGLKQMVRDKFLY